MKLELVVCRSPLSLTLMCMLALAGCADDSGEPVADASDDVANTGDAAEADAIDVADASDASDAANSGDTAADVRDAALDSADAAPDVADAAPDAEDAADSDAAADAVTDTGAGVCDPAAPVFPDLALVEVAGDEGCPPGMVLAGAFCIDRFEAALVEVAAEGSDRPWSPYFGPGETRVRAVSVAGVVPQGYISGDQAAAACAEAGKRLCTEVEWREACQGPDDFVYPYGATRMPGVCNDARAVHPVIEYFGTTESWIWSELGNACINQIAESLDRTGQNAECVSAVGAVDMMGNLHEWVDDAEGTFVGGYYVDTQINGNGCLYRTTAHATNHADYSTGFRCCADLEP